MTKDEHYYVLRGLIAWMGGYLDAGEQHGLSPVECGKLAKHITTALALWPTQEPGSVTMPTTGNALLDKLTSYAVEMSSTPDKMLNPGGQG